MNVRLSLALSLALTACPERREPERGLQLVYKKTTPDSVRSVLDRRLAQLKVRANLSEDDTTLTVRVPEGTDFTRIKALFAQPGHLEFCPEDVPVATRWCELKWPEAINARGVGSACSLTGPRKALDEALADAGIELSFENLGSEANAFVISACLSPRIVSAELQKGSLSLDFDRSGAKAFGELTRGAVGHRLIIRLNGAFHSAPIVQDAITSGKAMLTTGGSDRESMEVLAAALVGGNLPSMELMREERWGPPSLRR